MTGRILLAVLMGGLLVGCGKPASQSSGTTRELTVLCGAGIRPAMAPLAAEFEAANDVSIRVVYAGSGTHLGSLQAGADADLFLPGDGWWVEKAAEAGFVDTVRTVAWLTPVIAVQKGNPKGIHALADLARDDVAVGFGKPAACAIGNVSRRLLATADLGKKVTPDFEALTVNRLANQIKLQALDAAIIWRATAMQYPDSIDRVAVKDPDFHAVPLRLAVLKESLDPKLARKFAAFVAGKRGATVFREHHYQVPGSKLRMGCGASMRPPVEALIKKFEAQTGCKVLSDYGGSGPVLLQIEESKEGDVYICHDPYAYLCEDKKLSKRWHTIGSLEPILAVQKGNPKGVKGLKDLLREDLEIGLSHRKYSTRGKIVWAMFAKAGMTDQIAARRFFEERTHTLVNQLKLGAVDVATLWDAPARAMAEIDVVPIEDAFKVDAVTSATTGRTYQMKYVKVTLVRLTCSKEPLLAAQFARFCLSDEGRRILAQHHYRLPEHP